MWKVPPNLIAAEEEKPEPDPALIEALGARMRGWLDVFENLLAGSDHLLGEFGAADVCAFPFLKYAVLREPDDDELFHRVLEDHMPLGRSIRGCAAGSRGWISARARERGLPRRGAAPGYCLNRCSRSTCPTS